MSYNLELIDKKMCIDFLGTDFSIFFRSGVWKIRFASSVDRGLVSMIIVCWSLRTNPPCICAVNSKETFLRVFFLHF